MMSEHPEILTAQPPHLSDEQLAAWVADELTSDERGAAMSHLASCDICRGALAETQHIRALMWATASGASHADGSVVERVLAQLTSETTLPPVSASVRREIAVPSRMTSASQSPQGRRREVWRRVGALAAVLLLIAMSALLFTRLSGRGPAVTPTFTPGPNPLENISGHWAQALPKGGHISAVAAVSPTDIWAVGGVLMSNGQGSQDVVLLHFDGREWRRSPDSFPGSWLMSISMVSADEGWASGFMGASQPFLLHYTDGHWRIANRSLTITTANLQTLLLYKVQMASATSGWMLAQPSFATQTQLPATQVYEYLKIGEEYRWEPTTSWDGVNLSALSVVSDREVWFAGSYAGRGVVFRTTVTYLNDDPQSVVKNWDTHEWEVAANSLSSISMRSADDGWAAGGDNTNAGTLFHWDGAKWTPRPFAQTGIDGVVMTGENTVWVYRTLQSYLYATTGNQWFSYPLASDETIVTGAAITPTTFLAIVNSFKDPRNPVPVPRVYRMGQGTPLPTPYVAP